MMMKRSSKILFAAGGLLLVLSVGTRLYLEYAARQEARQAQALVEANKGRFTEAAPRPLSGADYVGRYDRAHASFLFNASAQPGASKTVPESELPAFIRTATPVPPKLLITYEAADFPVPADKIAFETRTRAALEQVGAKVMFLATTPRKSRALP